MIKFFLFVVVAASFCLGIPSAIRADSGRGEGEAIDVKTWKEMQRISSTIASEMETHKKDGTNPDAFFALAKTTLSYRLITIVAYHKPRSLEEAKNTAKNGNAFGIDVLAKQLLEYNRRSGINDPVDCLTSTCRKREVQIALTQKGLGISDEPIEKGIDYSTRIIHTP
jgi:hypothetical protein